jgi:hypothetical protein
MDKDRAIITQVCAKIAADMTDKSTDVDTRLGEFATLFSTVSDILMESIYGQTTTTTTATPTLAEQNSKVVSMVKEAFNAEEVFAPNASTSAGVSVKGQQHGPLPEWLIKACKRDGVTLVYDNRDGLAANPKRPSFKAVDAEKAYWPPRSR